MSDTALSLSRYLFLSLSVVEMAVLRTEEIWSRSSDEQSSDLIITIWWIGGAAVGGSEGWVNKQRAVNRDLQGEDPSDRSPPHPYPSPLALTLPPLSDLVFYLTLILCPSFSILMLFLTLLSPSALPPSFVILSFRPFYILVFLLLLAAGDRMAFYSCVSASSRQWCCGK